MLEEMIPARFQRETGSKIVGLLEYVVIVPILSLVATLLLMLPVFLLQEWADLPEEIAGWLFPVMFPVVLIALTRWSIRDYRRRAFTEVVVHHNRIELTIRKKHRKIGFDEIRSVHLVRARLEVACVLQMESGESIPLPDEIAPFSRLRAPLEATLIAHLVRKLPERLEREQEIPVRQSVFQAVFLVSFGGAVIGLAALLCLTIRFFRAGVALFRTGCFWIRVGRLASRGGFIVRHDGVFPTPRGRGRFIPWAEVALLHRDACGITLEAIGGERISASLLARDCWPVSEWIQRLHAQRRKETSGK